MYINLSTQGDRGVSITILQLESPLDISRQYRDHQESRSLYTLTLKNLTLYASHVPLSGSIPVNGRVATCYISRES